MPLNQPVSLIMTASPVVGTQSSKFSQILRLFNEFPVHHLPIVDDNKKLIGILSSNDLPRLFQTLCNDNVQMSVETLDNAVSIKNLMTPNPFTITSGTSIIDAAKIFAEKKFLALPVVDNGELIGIVSLKDVVKYIAERN